ncbi:MAG: outer membrane protein assembly factor BamE [Conchiformibius sp.]|nr:outer membrane protein assembly factor BamE [Conchiformibius sp.]
MKTWFLPIIAAALLGACTPKLVAHLPYYKLPVIQGMPFDAEAVRTLQPGLTREQVLLLIGAPLLRPSFRNDRWDYSYEIARGGKIKEQHSLTVYFQGNVVSKIEGSALEQAKQK